MTLSGVIATRYVKLSGVIATRCVKLSGVIATRCVKLCGVMPPAAATRGQNSRENIPLKAFQ